MRRVRLSTGPAALFGAMLLVAMIIFLPMRLALGWADVGERGLVSRAVSGSIWGATMREARFGNLALGDLAVRLSPLPLLVGRAAMVLDGPGEGGLPLSGTAFVSRHTAGVDDLTARIATGRAFAPLPVSGVDLDGFSVRFEDGRCVEAGGRVRATLAGDAGGIALPPSAEGVARCEAGALLLPLASQSGTEAIALFIQGDGNYRAELSVRPTDPFAGERLERAGFVAGPDGYRLSVQGGF